MLWTAQHQESNSPASSSSMRYLRCAAIPQVSSIATSLRLRATWLLAHPACGLTCVGSGSILQPSSTLVFVRLHNSVQDSNSPAAFSLLFAFVAANIPFRLDLSAANMRHMPKHMLAHRSGQVKLGQVRVNHARWCVVRSSVRSSEHRPSVWAADSTDHACLKRRV
jgi:hypothetical protein